MFKFVQTFVMAKRSSYLDLVLNPLNLLRTKRILHVNPTVIPQRKEPEQINLYVYDYDAETLHQQKLAEVKDAFLYKNSATVTWINVDGIRRKDIEEICNHFDIHSLVLEDILSIGQRPKMDDIDERDLLLIEHALLQRKRINRRNRADLDYTWKKICTQFPGRCFKRCV